MQLNNNTTPNTSLPNRNKGIVKRKKTSSAVWIVITFVFVLFVSIGVYYFFIFKGDLSSTSIKTGQYHGAENSHLKNDDGFLTAQIHLYQKKSIQTKESKIALNPVMVVMVEGVVNDFLKHLPEELTGIQLISAFKDKDNVLYLDFNGELKYKSLFDTSEEFLFLKALYNTIFVNFKAITNVRIMVEGKEIETLSGHINISKGLKEVFEQ